MNQPKIVLVSSDDRMLHVQFTAAARLEDFLPLLEEIRRQAEAHKVISILIDARVFQEKVTVVQRLQVAVAVVDKFLGYQVAGVISTESFDPKLLAETMARNRGANVKMTTSLPEAMEWLSGTKPGEAGSPATHT